jgi:hypothetical protein
LALDQTIYLVRRLIEDIDELSISDVEPTIDYFMRTASIRTRQSTNFSPRPTPLDCASGGSKQRAKRDSLGPMESA